jgi:hypothetical protein
MGFGGYLYSDDIKKPTLTANLKKEQAAIHN